MFADTYESFQMGQLSEDAAIEASLGAIRDFRSKVVAHYSAWSSLDDLSTSANFDFKANSKNELGSAKSQIEESRYNVDESSFKVVKKDSDYNSVRLSLSSPSIGTVSSVDYVLDNGLGRRSSDVGKRNYSVVIETADEMPETISGVATVRLDNGHEFKVQFKL